VGRKRGGVWLLWWFCYVERGMKEREGGGGGG